MQRFLFILGVSLCAGMGSLTEHPQTSNKWWLEQEGFFGNLAQTQSSSHSSIRKIHPVFEDPGRSFDGSTDFMDIGTSSNSTEGHFISQQLGGDGFSFYANIKLSELRPWTRFFDFGDPTNVNNIAAGTIEDSDKIYFEVHSNGAHVLMHGGDLKVEVGKANSWLFVVKPDGAMEIWRDGYLIKEHTGIPVARVDRPNLFIGKPSFIHPDQQDSYFKGEMEDIKVFNAAIDWALVTPAKKAEAWPGLTNGDFDPEQQTYQIDTYSEGVPFGWISRGKTFLATARGVGLLGGPIPDEPAGKLFAALDGKQSELRQVMGFLEKGKTYWVAFRTAHAIDKPNRLDVHVDEDRLLDAMVLGNGEWTEQLISFRATRSDHKAELIFKNPGLLTGAGQGDTVFIGDVRVSDFPDCYEKFHGQSTCNTGDAQTTKLSEVSEAECRQHCEKEDCKFLLYDPITYEGGTYCEIYPDCGVITSYYGGEAGTLFRRMPCALGGMMSPAAAKTYHLPTDPSQAEPIDGEGYGNASSANSSHHGNSSRSNSSYSNSSMAANYYYANAESANPLIGAGPTRAREEGSSERGVTDVEHFAYPGTVAGEGHGVMSGQPQPVVGKHSAALPNEVDFPAAPQASDLGLHNT